MGYLVTLRIRGFQARIPFMCSIRLWTTSLWGSQWPLIHTWNRAVINIKWVGLPPCQWHQVSVRAGKWLIKRCLKKLYILSQYFHSCFRQVNICCSIADIWRPISLWNGNTTNQAIAMSRYQSYFKSNHCAYQWLSVKYILFEFDISGKKSMCYSVLIL